MGIFPRGTTPTISYRFDTVPVATLTAAYLTIRQCGTEIEKTIADAVIDAENNRICWTLSQEETLRVDENATVEMQIRWKQANGTAGKSRSCTMTGDKLLRDGVI